MNRNKFSVRCIKHDFIFQINADKHYNRKQGCKYCGAFQSITSRTFSLETWIKRLEILYNTEEYKQKYGHNHYDYSLATNIVKSNEDKITVRCIEHDHIFNIKLLGHFNNKNGCKYCARKIQGPKRFTNEDIDRRIKEQGRDYLIERITNIVGTFKNCWWRCKICDWIWETFPSYIYNSRNGCPHCKISRGEIGVSKILKYHNFQYDIQFSFEDLINPDTNRFLYFDFIVYDDKQHILCLIEYQGKFHFEPVIYTGKFSISIEQAMINFELLKYRDQIKRDYCKKYNIHLIEIPYWQYDRGNRVYDESNLEYYLLKNIDLIKEYT